MAKPTYNPSKIIRKRRHGFRARTAAGGQVLKARRAKGRARLSAQLFVKKNCRIRKRKEFLDIAQSGFYFKSGLIVVQCKSNQSEKIRVGFTASKKVGNAVVRNRCKRRMRALADIVLSDAEGIIADYVFIARRNTAFADWNSLVSEGNQAIAFLQKKMSAQCAHS